MYFTSRRIVTLLGLCWLIVGWWWTRDHFLDDALIHLQYARGLQEAGFLTVDGVTRTSGASSPLYVLVLSWLLRLWPDPHMAKLLSMAGHLAVFLTLIRQVFATQGSQRTLWTLLTTVCLSPFAFRWLADGMETSWWAWLTILIALLASRATHNNVPLREAAAAAVVACGAALLRPELAIIALAVALAGLMRARQVVWWLLTAGVLLGMAGAWWWTGVPYPDSMIAKSYGAEFWRVTAAAIAGGLVSPGLFGIGLVLIWITAGIVWLVDRPDERLTAVAVNACVPLFLGTALARGQWIQGIRPVLWVFVFAAVWSISRVRPATRNTGMPQWTAVALLVLFGVQDLIRAVPVVEGRSAAYRSMSATTFDTFRGQQLLAYDVGFVGWFTRARVCDVNGVVMGRDMAWTPLEARVPICAAREPVAAFVTAEQREEVAALAPDLHIDAWVECRAWSFTNVRNTPVHHLLLRPDDPRAANGCAALGDLQS